MTLKPPLKFAGGKRWLVPYLEPIWAHYKDRRLVEPFCGGLAVTLGLQPEAALLNDINPHLINFFNWCKKGLNVRIDCQNDEQLYYQHRDTFNQLISRNKLNTRLAAQLFYYLNRTGYNGLCRFNKKGFYNVPFGSYTTITYARNFLDYKPVLADWCFQSQDFFKVQIHPDDFIYADPPFDVPFTHYSKEGFDWDDQVRLAYWLSQHKGPVVASNQATDRIVELYEHHGFEVRILDAPRRISCTGDRAKAKEILALKNI